MAVAEEISVNDPRLQRCAFAKLQGDDGFEYFIRKYETLLGRRSSSAQADVVLGDNMNLSRKHAAITYNFDKGVFELTVMGKNGVTIDGVLFTPNSSPAPLASQVLLAMGDRQFYFLLPKLPGRSRVRARAAKRAPDQDAPSAASHEGLDMNQEPTGFHAQHQHQLQLHQPQLPQLNSFDEPRATSAQAGGETSALHSPPPQQPAQQQQHLQAFPSAGSGADAQQQQQLLLLQQQQWRQMQIWQNGGLPGASHVQLPQQPPQQQAANSAQPLAAALQSMGYPANLLDLQQQQQLMQQLQESQLRQQQATVLLELQRQMQQQQQQQQQQSMQQQPSQQQPQHQDAALGALPNLSPPLLPQAQQGGLAPGYGTAAAGGGSGGGDAAFKQQQQQQRQPPPDQS